MSSKHTKALAERLKHWDIPENKIEGIVFNIVDYFLDNISDAAIDAGAYYNSPLNGDTNMVKSYKEILWAMYEEIKGSGPKSPGLWVAIDPINGITIHSDRPSYVIKDRN